MVRVKEDLTGQQFGRLTVIERAEDHIKPNGQSMAMWKCQCSCKDKTIKIISGAHLKLAAKYQGEWASVAPDFVKYNIEVPDAKEECVK